MLSDYVYLLWDLFAAYTKALELADDNDYQLISVALAMCSYQSQDIESATKSLIKWLVLGLQIFSTSFCILYSAVKTLPLDVSSGSYH